MDYLRVSSSVDSFDPEEESTNKIYQVNEYPFIAESKEGWDFETIKNRCLLDENTNEFFDVRYIDV